jgi:hypothetical protein
MSGFDGSALYMRRYRVIIGSGGSGIDVSELRVTFKIEKSMAETPNYSEISIFNLSPATENQIIKTGDRVILEAGYIGPQYGLIFDGEVVKAYRDKIEGTTYMLTLICQDGDQFLNDGFVNASYAKGQTPRDIANQITSTASTPIELDTVSENLENKALPRGKVCFGLSRDYLHQIARTEQASFYVNDGKVNIVKAMDLPRGRIVDLSPKHPKSGLVGAAERTDDGIKGRCLLHPLLNLNTFVNISNQYVREQKAARGSQPKQMDYDGIYRILKLTHEGDTRGDNWYTEFVGVSQPGASPETGETWR